MIYTFLIQRFVLSSLCNPDVRLETIPEYIPKIFGIYSKHIYRYYSDPYKMGEGANTPASKVSPYTYTTFGNQEDFNENILTSPQESHKFS